MSNVLDAFNKSKKDIPDIRYVLPGSGETIFMKPFTTSDQKSILKALEKEDNILVQEAFDQVLRNCVLSENFDPTKLYTKDRECLLIELSKNSVKDDIEHTWKCGSCGKKNKLKLSIDSLNFSDIVEGSIVEKEITFDDFDFTVKLKNTTRDDEKKITMLGKKAGDKNGISQSEVITAIFASVIKEAKVLNGDGIEVFEPIKFEDRVKIFEQLTISDKKKIESFFKEVKNYGYDLTVKDTTCNHCPEISDVTIGWIDFFIM